MRVIVHLCLKKLQILMLITSICVSLFSHCAVCLLQKEYRKDYEEQMKGKALVDVDQTPGYLTARHASSLLSEVT